MYEIEDVGVIEGMLVVPIGVTVAVVGAVSVGHEGLRHLCRSSSSRAIRESLFATISNISVRISPSFFTSALVFFSSVRKQN